VALWKNGWPLAPIPHTRTFKSRVARGADPWADITVETSRQPEKRLNSKS
jgi:hypothetical protein